MGMWPFSKKSDPKAAELAAIAGLQCQTTDLAARCAKAGEDLSELLERNSVLLLLFGFVDYYAVENKIKNNRQRVHLAVNVFRAIFGDHQGNQMFGALQSAFRDERSDAWCREGFNAAKEFESSGLRLVEVFFQGGLDQ